MNKETKSRLRPVLTRILILSGLLVIVIVILLVREGSHIEANSESASAIPIESVKNAVPTYGAPISTDESSASQWKYAIANAKPTLVFFHSNTCKSCLDMIDTVYEVYPEFSKQIVLIDVDVYDPQNEGLINRVGINFIPTLVFYNQTGDSLFSIGVISSEELRQKLSDISQGKIP